MEPMLDEAAPTLATWLALEADADPAALPRPLRRELASAALADAQAAIALALAAPDLGPEGAAWAADATAAALLALGRAREALDMANARLARAPTIAAARLRAEALLALGDREGALGPCASWWSASPRLPPPGEPPAT